MPARLLFLLTALVACKPKPGDTDVVAPPPEICHEPIDLDGADLFDEKTDDWGLTDVRGNRITTVDYDGDGWTDLLVNPGASHVNNDLDGGTQYNFLLRNEHGTFRDVTAESGLLADREGDDDRAFQLATWGDIDNDGDLDLFTGYWRDRNAESTWTGDLHEVFLNDGDGTFTLAPPSDASYDSPAAGGTFVDYDRDGKLDLFVVSWYHQYGALEGDQDRLLRGNGDGTFDDVTDAAGLAMGQGSTSAYLAGTLRRPGFAGAACDVDDDGDSDLVVSNYGRSWNQLWRNDGGSFTDIGPQSGFAGDDNLDYSDNEFYRCQCTTTACDPDPGPPSIACSGDYWSDNFDDQPARLNGNTFTTVCGDVDNDGDMDLYNAEIVHWHIGGSSDPSELLLNDGTGSFTRPGNEVTGLVRERSGAWNEGDLMAAFLDIDNDGWKDILLASSDYPDTRAWLYRQVEAGKFEEIGQGADLDHEFASGLAVADFDRDGDLDLVMGQSTARGGAAEPFVRFWENDAGPGNHTEILLVGEGANKNGLGARVTIEAGGLTQTFDVQGSYGHVGIQNGLGVWAGLGAACNIDKITVRWPDAANTVETWEDVRANYTVRLLQGGGIAYVTE